jgi:hypothetical protein
MLSLMLACVPPRVRGHAHLALHTLHFTPCHSHLAINTLPFTPCMTARAAGQPQAHHHAAEAGGHDGAAHVVAVPNQGRGRDRHEPVRDGRVYQSDGEHGKHGEYGKYG